jgi:hypothetical protein
MLLEYNKKQDSYMYNNFTRYWFVVTCTIEINFSNEFVLLYME